MGKNAVALSAENFDAEVLRAKGLVVVDFWAEWCGPCRMLAPVIDGLAEEFAGRARICKLDIESSPELAARYGVMSIPTVLFFKDGKLVDRTVGLQPREELIVLMEKNL